jgi:LysM repeat protein
VTSSHGSHARTRQPGGRHARPRPPIPARAGARVVAPAVLSASLVVGSAAAAQAATPVPTKPGAGPSYVVVPGDSLWAIGIRESVDWRVIARLNGIDAPFVIYPGEKLVLPGPASTEVKTVVQWAPPALLVRARAFVETVGSGRPDPFYGQASYRNLCGELAARINGHFASGYPSAIAQWRAYVAAGVAHVGDTHPPPGALLFWYTPTNGHVAVYLGGGQVVTNDIYDFKTGLHGGVYFAPASAITSSMWRLPYLGWAPPVYR